MIGGGFGQICFYCHRLNSYFDYNRLLLILRTLKLEILIAVQR